MPYLVDGNNLLGSWGGPRQHDDRRPEVVRRVAEFCRLKGGVKATIVFDGHPLRGDMAQQQIGNVALRVPPEGVDADTVIRELIDRAPRPSELVVVSSDKELFSYARTMGASTLRAHEWNTLERQLLGQKEKVAGSEKPEREDDLEGWMKKFGASE